MEPNSIESSQPLISGVVLSFFFLIRKIPRGVGDHPPEAQSLPSPVINAHDQQSIRGASLRAIKWEIQVAGRASDQPAGRGAAAAAS